MSTTAGTYAAYLVQRDGVKYKVRGQYMNGAYSCRCRPDDLFIVQRGSTFYKSTWNNFWNTSLDGTIYNHFDATPNDNNGNYWWRVRYDPESRVILMPYNHEIIYYRVFGSVPSGSFNPYTYYYSGWIEMYRNSSDPKPYGDSVKDIWNVNGRWYVLTSLTTSWSATDRTVWTISFDPDTDFAYNTIETPSNWSQVNGITDTTNPFYIEEIKYLNGLYVAIGQKSVNGTDRGFLVADTSEFFNSSNKVEIVFDGTNTSASSASESNIYDIAYANNTWYVGGGGGRLHTASSTLSSSTSWTTMVGRAIGPVRRVVTNGTTVVTAGDGSSSLSSPVKIWRYDGSAQTPTWTQSTVNGTNFLQYIMDMKYADGKFVLSGKTYPSYTTGVSASDVDKSVLYSEDDGVTWNIVTTEAHRRFSTDPPNTTHTNRAIDTIFYIPHSKTWFVTGYWTFNKLNFTKTYNFLDTDLFLSLHTFPLRSYKVTGQYFKNTIP